MLVISLHLSTAPLYERRQRRRRSIEGDEKAGRMLETSPVRSTVPRAGEQSDYGELRAACEVKLPIEIGRQTARFLFSRQIYASPYVAAIESRVTVRFIAELRGIDYATGKQ